MDLPQELCVVCSQEQYRLFHYQSHDYFRCPTCGLVSTYPYPGEQEIIEHYARGFDEGNYYRLRQWSEQYLQIYVGMAKFLEQNVNAHGLRLAGKKVLDVGCFTGEFIGVLESMDIEAYGVELQSRAVEIANRKFPGRIFQVDVFDSVLPQAEFDVITMLGLIEHVREPVKLMQRVTEILKPGGFLLIQTPNSGSVLARLMRQFWPPYAPVEHIHLFSRRSLELTLSKLGLRQFKFKPHWKWLPIGYVYNNFQVFSPTLFRLTTPFFRLFGKIMFDWRLPFYGGEMLMIGRKPLA